MMLIRARQPFLFSFGFSLNMWQILAAELIQHAAQHEVRSRTITEHGVKYVIEGELNTPGGRNPQVRTVWIIDHKKNSTTVGYGVPAEGEEL